MEAEKQQDQEKPAKTETVTSVKETLITNGMYKTVARDMKALSRTVQEPEKAAQAHRVSLKLEKFNETNPAPAKQQQQIMQFLRAKEQLLAKERSNEKGFEHER